MLFLCVQERDVRSLACLKQQEQNGVSYLISLILSYCRYKPINANLITLQASYYTLRTYFPCNSWNILYKYKNVPHVMPCTLCSGTCGPILFCEDRKQQEDSDKYIMMNFIIRTLHLISVFLGWLNPGEWDRGIRNVYKFLSKTSKEIAIWVM